MYEYDEFDEERDLKNFKPDTNITEFGDEMNKSNICAGVLLFACIGGLIACACARGCQEIKKHVAKAKNPTVQMSTTNTVQNVR